MYSVILLDDEVIKRVDERRGEQNLSRSEFITAAAERYLAELEADDLVTAIDSALARGTAPSPD